VNIFRSVQLHITAKAKESAVLWTLLSIVFFVGVVLIYVSHDWKEAVGELTAEILRDLGIACCISALIAFVIEVGLARKMFANGLDAIMRRTVPPEVWEEIRQRVISQPVIREGFRLAMDIAQPKEGEEYLSKTTLQYVLVSLQDGLNFYVEHELDAHRNPRGMGAVAERFTFVEKGMPLSKEHQTYRGQELKHLLSADGLALKFPATFEHNRDKVPVTIQFTEVVQLPDIVTWWMTTASLNPEFVVANLPPNIAVDLQAHHPAQNQLKPNGPRGWKFDGVMLPGQGVEFRFKKL
jgi:hypothetical protein